MQTCEFCGKDHFKKVKIHQLSCSANPKRSLSYVASTRGRRGTWSDSQRLRHSEVMRKVMREVVARHPESYRGRWARGKCPVIYAGESYDSAWELVVKKYLDSVGIDSTREVPSFSYVHNGVERNYFPDFYLPSLEMYLEVKGFMTDRDISKWKAFPARLLVLTRLSIRHVKNGRHLNLQGAANKRIKLLIDGLPLHRINLSVTNIRRRQRRAKLTRQERSQITKAALAASPKVQARRQKAEELALVRQQSLNPKYAGSNNSQYGSYWITDGTRSMKWNLSKGVLPRGFYLGRTLNVWA